MVGFVGTRAKKRRRNYFIFSIIILLFVLIILLFPNIKLNEDILVPDDSLLPDPNEEIFSLSSTIEDLNLTIFQKDQKIKFRDGQINNLKKEIIDLKTNLENIESNYINLQDEYNILIEMESSKKTIDIKPSQLNDLNNKIKNLNKLNKKNQALIIKFQEEVSNLKNENKLSFTENESLKREYESVASKNIKLLNLVKNLESIVENQKIDIKKLKDISHHNR